MNIGMILSSPYNITSIYRYQLRLSSSVLLQGWWIRDYFKVW